MVNNEEGTSWNQDVYVCVCVCVCMCVCVCVTSLVAWWSELLTTNHEVPGSIPGSNMCVFP